MLQLLIAIQFASAAWLVKAPTANPQEFAVYSQNSDFQKISTYFLRCEEKTQIIEDFKKAQILFLDGSLDKAKQQFSLIAEKKWSCDWSENERQLILFSFLRMAQLEPDSLRKTEWLEQAAQFDIEWTPDSTIFPPPITTQFHNIRRQVTAQKIVLPLFAKNYSALLRNGRFMSLAQLSLQAPAGKARYTFVSDTYQLETVFVTISELENLILKPQPYVFGDCDNFQLSENLKWVENVSIFHSLQCVKGQEQNSIAVTKKDQTLSMSATAEPSVPEKTWIQRNGLWLGTAIVGSLLLSYHLSTQDRDKTVAVPTTTLYQKPAGTD